MAYDKDTLKGKVSLVIGGSGESGPAVCDVLARHGTDLALTYCRNRAGAEAVAARARELGARAHCFSLDLLSMELTRGLIATVTQAMGGLDILVCLGGPAPVFTDFRTLSEEEFDSMLDSHFKACFFLARDAACHMERHGGGLIVTVSATSSMKYSHVAYGLAKACVTQMTAFLASAFAPTVRVINLIPGLIEIEETEPQLRRQRAQQSPLKRNVRPEELGLMVVAAASEAFRAVSGASILMDGGFWLLHP
jgi:NAD(P)-dependent dehydrogenase (short-subunit alcohol dehydrogenase family)